MLYEHVELLEAAFVKKHRKPFTSRELAFLVLGVDPFLTSSHSRTCSAFYQFLDLFLLNAHIVNDESIMLDVSTWQS